MRQAEHSVLSVRNLSKKIGKKWVIQDVSFEVGEGEIFGFLGPNGSGKTTTIRMLVDLIRPTEGEIWIKGKNVQKQHDEAMRHVGSIVENPELYTYLTGWENLEHFAGMLSNVTVQRIEEVVRIVGMEQRIHDKVKTYSLGMRQRLGIAQALLGDPKLLILDEPTNGLDPQGIKELRQFISTLADEGLSLFISSHLLSEVQMLCNRVAIILNGKVVAVGKVDELLDSPVRHVDWHVDAVDQAQLILREEEGIEIIEPTEEANVKRVIISTKMPPEKVQEINKKFVKSEVKVYAIEVRQPKLEDLFLDLTGGGTID